MEAKEKKEAEFIKTKELAELFSITSRRVQQLTEDGVLKPEKIGRSRSYELRLAVQSYIKYLSDKAKGKGGFKEENELKKQKLEAEIALKENQAEIQRIKADIATGKYIDIEEVIMDYQKFFVTFKRFALGIPSRLVSMISDSLEPLEARRAEEEMSAEIRRMLQAFVVSGYVQGESGEKKEGRKRAKT